tara:strand:+ start:534 stop:797 length:264 start_codon:yes stop_codon:yes gene_type:complete
VSLLTVAVALGAIVEANPCVSLGFSVFRVVTIFGVSLMSAGTVGDSVFGEVNCVSFAPSVATTFTVITVADPTDAFNLADISTVFDV